VRAETTSRLVEREKEREKEEFGGWWCAKGVKLIIESKYLESVNDVKGRYILHIGIIIIISILHH